MEITEQIVIAKPRKRRRSDGVTKGIPYASATANMRAREETTRILRKLGCESVGFLDDYEKHEVLLQFTHRGRQVSMRVSAKGWAQAYLKEHPWKYLHRKGQVEHEQAALAQGRIAINSILRDWTKAQVMAIECGILSFEAVFLPHMLTHDGRPLIERVADLLPKPDDQKIVALPAR